MTVYFGNNGNIELDTIRTMGVSVKLNDNPIGYFGTGLKYAIAVLLRAGAKVRLFTDNTEYEFTTREVTIRGEKFNLVFMNDEQLAFTTEFGKNWEIWHAYRELYSNCMDEEGAVTRKKSSMDTVWAITHPDIESVHDQRAKIFLHTEPSWLVDGLEIHRGKSSHIYYRGVRVCDLPIKTMYTYNFTCDMKLTEDRTLYSVSDAQWKLETRLPKITDPIFCNRLVTANSLTSWEGGLSLSNCYEPSEEFLDTIEGLRKSNEFELNKDLIELLRSKRQVEERILAKTTAVEEQTISDALELVKKLDTNLKRDELIIVEHISPSVYACVEHKKIYITTQTIANGVDFLAITIYEEWIHRDFGYSDNSRGMQQFLFDKILKLIKEM